MTMVAGEVIVEDGKIKTVDEEALKAEVRELMPIVRAQLKKADEAARRLEPYYREMYLRCARQEMVMNRRLNEGKP
jgi:5-methylthioadenosine/S-adenosylhomocysteine deaminase